MIDALIIFAAEYLIFILTAVAAIYVLSMEMQSRKFFLTVLLVASILALILDKISNRLVVSPRPFVIENITPLFPHIADNGFPSEHALFAMVIAGVVFVYNRKLGIVLGILAIIVGLARVIADVHHTIDVLGAYLIAMLSVGMGWYIVSRTMKF